MAPQDLVTHIHVQYANSLVIVPLCIRADTGLTCMTILAVQRSSLYAGHTLWAPDKCFL